MQQRPSPVLPPWQVTPCWSRRRGREQSTLSHAGPTSSPSLLRPREAGARSYSESSRKSVPCKHLVWISPKPNLSAIWLNASQSLYGAVTRGYGPAAGPLSRLTWTAVDNSVGLTLYCVLFVYCFVLCIFYGLYCIVLLFVYYYYYFFINNNTGSAKTDHLVKYVH